MWCASCQDDVATEISEDGQALKCTTCGESVQQVFAPSLHPETKSARELLKKWAEEQKQISGNRQTLPSASEASNESGHSDLTGEASGSEESGPNQQNDSEIPAEKPDASLEESPAKGDVLNTEVSEVTQHDQGPAQSRKDGEEPVANQKPSENTTKSTKAKYRIDAAHVPQGQLTSPAEEHVNESSPQGNTETHRGPTQEVPVVQSVQREVESEAALNAAQAKLNLQTARDYYTHHAHEQTPTPHFDVSEAAKKAKSRPGRVESIWGQLMAYAGVGVLTIGTVMVLWGYFGMVEQFASTGWLISTAGQMLLLLGIVTLISGGMQQTTHEVTERIEYLGGRMIRIEQSTDELLKGPHFGQRSIGRETVEEGEQERSA